MNSPKYCNISKNNDNLFTSVDSTISNTNSYQPSIKLDKHCLSHSGQSALVINAFKIACLC